MRFPSITGSLGLIGVTLLPITTAKILESTALNPCMANSGFTAPLFEVTYFPSNGTVAYNINAISTISGNVTAYAEVFAYGYRVINETLDVCSVLACPLTPGPLPIDSNNQISPSVGKNIPNIAYAIPDIDILVKVTAYDGDHNMVVCVEAELSNGHTVDLTAVQWVTAIIAGLGLLASAVTSGLGHSNTAAHVAANALSLFGFFQAQALIGMASADLPPIVQSWTQDFQWSMGMISIGFMQTICTWYQRATGGMPATLLSSIGVTSIELQKRALDYTMEYAHRIAGRLAKRQAQGTATGTASTTTVTVLHGIKRVGFRAGIETTNIFLTGLAFFIAFAVAVSVGVALFKAGCEGAVRAGWLKSDKFQEFRSGWKIVLKGILYRIILIGYTQMTVLCLWELIERDSAAEVVLALFYLIAMTVALLWAAYKVVRIAKKSVNMHKNPAYILYSDPKALNKWGFLYVQFRATAYYFILPVLGYTFLKSAFIAFAQGSPKIQAIGLLIIEAAALVGVCILKPWMDKKTNAFNVSIAVINFVNVIFLLFFTNIFNQPTLVTGIMSVVFFIYNAVFALVLLLMVLFASVYALYSKNPDTRYQPMRDDRGSFIKSQSQLTTELDALGATARGDQRLGYKLRDLEDDGSDSYSNGSSGKGGNARVDAAGVPLPPSTAGSGAIRNEKYGGDHMNPPLSPVDPSAPFIPSNNGPRHNSPAHYSDAAYNSNNSSGFYSPSRSMNSASPTPARFGGYDRTGSLQSSRANTLGSNLNSGYARPQQGGQQPQQGGMPWQRGAGYDH
ncbi:hypothetical protein MMC25_003700 [Agyrium rufum]|nr:hypothetical protein [Agyrium rufum]